MGIDTVHVDNPAWLRFNFGGKSIDYDFTPVVKFAETDTSLTLDTVNRALVYNAEKHTDTISSREFGRIFHIADFGDVDITGVTNNSLFVYQKNSDCGEGCEGIDNSWIAWNSSEHLTESMSTVMGFDEDDAPQALNHPDNTTQYYQLSWAGADKVKWTQPVEKTLATGDTLRVLVEDPETKQPMYIGVDITIASDGTITFKKEGS